MTEVQQVSKPSPQSSPVQHKAVFNCLNPISSGTYANVFGTGSIALKASSNLRMSAGIDAYVEDDASNLGDTAKDVLKRSELIEAMILYRFSRHKNPNVAFSDQIFFDSFVGSRQFSLILQLERARGSLIDYIGKGSKFEFTKRVKMVGDLAKGVFALHNLLGVSHGDLKPGNVLVELDENNMPHCRIADFGMSTLVLFAVHGHAAEVYTYGHVAPECCDRLHCPPYLIQASPEAVSTLCSFSCFAAPVLSKSLPVAPPSTPQSNLYCDETLPNGESENFITPTTSQTTIESTPETVTSSTSFPVNVTISKFAPAVATSSSSLFSFKPARPQQANSVVYENTTNAWLSSDIWALASIIIFIASNGDHPVIDHCFDFMRNIKVTRNLESVHQLNSRVQMAMWYVALKNHQRTDTWSKVFNFKELADDFQDVTSSLRGFAKNLPNISLDADLKDAKSTELDLIYSCMQFLPTERLTIEQVCQHPFLNPPMPNTSAKKVGRKRRQSLCIEPQVKKVKQQQFDGLLSLALTRLQNFSLKFIKMPFHNQVTRLLMDICMHFKFSSKSLILANAYIYYSATKIVTTNGIPATELPAWTLENCKIHAITCLLLATSLFEPRHDTVVEVLDIVVKFGEEHKFTLAEIATCQRLLVEVLDFEFDIPNATILIDFSLSATNTTHLMPQSQLVSTVTDILMDSPSMLCTSQAVLLALALLKRFDCKDAFQHLLKLSGAKLAMVKQTLLQIE